MLTTFGQSIDSADLSSLFPSLVWLFGSLRVVESTAKIFALCFMTELSTERMPTSRPYYWREICFDNFHVVWIFNFHPILLFMLHFVHNVTISTPYLVNVIKSTLRLLNWIENDLQDTYTGEIKITEPTKLLEIFAFIKDKSRSERVNFPTKCFRSCWSYIL